MRPEESFLDALRSCNSFVVLAHVNPDADAYGSMRAAQLMLESLGKKACLLNVDGLIPRYEFIPGIENVHTSFSTLPEDLDAVFVVDCGALKRIGDPLVPDLESTTLKTFSVDHHEKNPNFADHNYVDATASSTCELIFRLCQDLGVRLEPKLASSMYVGLIGDTGSFRYPSTTPEVFELALALVRAGAKPDELASGLYGNMPVRSLRLQARALSELELFSEGRISFVTVSKSLMDELSASPDDAEELVERARDLEGVQLAAFLREEDGFVKGSLRSVNEQFDVAEIAARFGGGGHKAAAGFRTKKPLSELREELIPILEALLN